MMIKLENNFEKRICLTNDNTYGIIKSDLIIC